MTNLNKVKYLLPMFIGCAGTNNTENLTFNDDVDSSIHDASVPDATTLDTGVDADVTPHTSDAEVICGQVTLATSPVVLNVVLIVDQSLSMADPFNNSLSRWDALKSSLLADDGLIKSYQNQVNFGLSLFTGIGPLGEHCPYVTQVPTMLNNFEAIKASYDAAKPLNNTPTGDSINKIVSTLTLSSEPTVFILATDGEPDTCKQPWPQEGQPESVAAVTAAYNLGITTYVVAVAKEVEISQKHIDDLANAGQGTVTGAQSYRVTDDSGLRAALTSIVSGSISCTIPLKGQVTTDNVCSGTVTLNGFELPCQTTDGWDLIDNSIHLYGDSCQLLKFGGVLEAKFPCGTVTVI
jgi:hypothetical protein